MADNENTNTVDTAEIDETSTPKTYTQEEVDALLKSESDRRVTKALKTQQEKYDKQLKLANLDENARNLAERDNTIAELQKQLADFNIERNKSEVKTVLGNHGLPVAFADLISVSDDMDETLTRVNTLEKVFKDAVAEEVKKRLGGATPTAGTKGTSAVDFKKMSLAEKQALYNSNRDLYNLLSKQ